MGNADLLERSRRAVWHPCTQMKHHETQPLVPIVRGEGAWLFDAEGGRYLDAVSSWWTNLFGHNQPHIKAAIVDQMELIEHVRSRLAAYKAPRAVVVVESVGRAPNGKLSR